MQKIAILLFLFAPLFAFSQENYLKEFSKKWQSASEYTQNVMAKMPQKHYGFRPVKDEMSFEEQLIHMANNMNWLSYKFLEAKTVPDELAIKGKSRKEIVELVMTAIENVQRIADNFDPNRLDDKVDFPAGELSKRQIFTLLNDHHTHHRAQLLVYLRVKGEKPPAYVGW